LKKIIIAIDGHSSTGKSTLAKQLAEHLDYIYIDSGAMYRAVTLYAIENGFISSDGFDKTRLIQSLSGLQIAFNKDSRKNVALFLNGQLVSSKIRTMEVSNMVSQVAALPEVRKCLVKEQRLMGLNRGLVMDGRDIGSVVFPDAELKIFMTASANTRALRRFDELSNRDESIDYKTVYENIIFRDKKDSSRKNSPLLKAIDARILDNSKLDQEAQFKLVLSWVDEFKKDTP
jgi:cytidylate kinase|tara:strand:+ start:7306 stop:7998 length:693 start_codon:yes stop_codon:yes gene_type:complete